MGTGEGRKPIGKGLDDGVRVLYRIDFDVNWYVKSIQKLRVFRRWSISRPGCLY